MLRAALCVGSSIVLAAAASAPAPETPQARITRTYAAHDFAGFLSAAQEWAAAPFAPPVAIYDLACAYAVNARPKEAIAALDRLADLGLSFAPQDDGDFASLKTSAELQRVVARFADNRTPVAKSTVAFTLPDHDITEGIAFDAKSQSYFVSRVHQRKIVRVHDGKVSDFIEPAQDGMWSPFGMQVDAARQRLWVAESAVGVSNGFTPAHKNRTGLIAFELTTGHMVAHYTLPQDGPHGFGDVIVASDGTLYTSDSLAPVIYRVTPKGGALEVLLRDAQLFSLQGMALSEDERTLYVAGYSDGVFAVDLAARKVTQLNAITGIDGLYREGRTLIGIVNGSTPHRVVAMSLEDPTRARVLERAAPQYDEPTLGVIHDHALLYIANSQWGKFGESGTPVAWLKADPAAILRLPLQP